MMLASAAAGGAPAGDEDGKDDARHDARLTLWRNSCARDAEAALVCECLSAEGGKAEDGKADFFKGWPEPLHGELRDLGALLFESVERGDVDGVLDVVEACKAQFGEETAVALLSARRVDEGNEFPLGVAASLGDVEIIGTLLEQGCCLASQNNCSESALHAAAMLGRTEAVQVLLDSGLDVLLHTPHAELGDVLIDRVLAEIAETTEAAGADEATAGRDKEALEQVAEQLLAAGATPSPKVMDIDLALFSKRLAAIIMEQQHKEASSQLSQQLPWQQEEAALAAAADNNTAAHAASASATASASSTEPHEAENKDNDEDDASRRPPVQIITATAPTSPTSYSQAPPKTESPKKKSYTTTKRALKQQQQPQQQQQQQQQDQQPTAGTDIPQTAAPVGGSAIPAAPAGKPLSQQAASSSSSNESLPPL